jgi:hypothetical protein
LYRFIDDKVAESHALVTKNGSKIINNNNLWQQRHGHLNFFYISSLTKVRMVVGMLDICEKKEACEECLACKQHILSFDEGKACGTKGVLELVPGDILLSHGL